MNNIIDIDEPIPLIDKLRQALIDLDAIRDTLEEMSDTFDLQDSATFQIGNVNKISAFIRKELHRRECELLERLKS